MKCSRLPSFFLAFLFHGLTLGQSFQSVIGVATAEVQNIVTDHENNTLVVGSFLGTHDFDPGPGVVNLNSGSDHALFLQKFDSTGEFVFAKKLPTRHLEAQLQVDSQGNIYIASDFYETVDLDPGTGVTNVTSFNNLQISGSLFADDVYIVKLNSDGIFQWGKRYGSIYADGIDIAIGPNDELIAAITYKGTLYMATNPTTSYPAGSDNDISLFSLDENGNINWVKNIGSADNNDWSTHVSVTPGGDILLSGVFFVNTDLDPDAGVATFTATAADAFVARYDSIGQYLNAKIYGGVGNQIGRHAFERNGSVYAEITYDTQIDADAGSGVFTFEQDTAARYIFLKDSVNYGLLWALEIPFGDAPPPTSDNNENHVMIADDGTIYAGYHLAQNTRVVINGQTIAINRLGLNDAILCKVNPNGTIAWFKRYGGEADPITGEEYLYSVEAVALKAPNHLVFGGYMEGVCDFDLGIGDGTLDVPNSSSGNSFLVTLVLTQDPGDLDDDGEVTDADVQILLASFGCTQCPDLDFNGDGLVSVADLYLYLDLIDG
ncbi:MAG: hypothetical protein ACK478_08105 [Flavobacteriales bacterium]|jgi:hypothetical protein